MYHDDGLEAAPLFTPRDYEAPSMFTPHHLFCPRDEPDGEASGSETALYVVGQTARSWKQRQTG